MNLKTVVSILVLLAMVWQSAGAELFHREPVHLGSGLGEQALNLSSAKRLTSLNYSLSSPVNLSSAKRLTSLNYSLSSPGYVSPKKPQTMALSSSLMVNQAKVILAEAVAAKDEAIAARDEAVAAREEAMLLRNETMMIYSETRKLLAEIDKSRSVLAEINNSKELLEKINEKELSIQSMQKKAESEAKASAASAAQASAFLNKTDETYGEILRLSAEIEENLETIGSAIQGARNFANTSVTNTIQSLSEVLPVAKKS